MAAGLGILDALVLAVAPLKTKLRHQLCKNDAQSHILRENSQQKACTGFRSRSVEFNAVKNVLLNSKHLPSINTCSPFEPHYDRPFSTTDRVGTVAYRLVLPPAHFDVLEFVTHHSGERSHFSLCYGASCVRSITCTPTLKE